MAYTTDISIDDSTKAICAHPQHAAHTDSRGAGKAAEYRTSEFGYSKESGIEGPGSQARRKIDSERASTVFLIEPESLFRKILAKSIDEQGNFQVVGTAADYSAPEDILSKRPDIIITEMFISGKGLSSLLEAIAPLSGNTKILILSRASDQAIGRQLQNLPVHGFVSKQEDPETLYKALDHLRTNPHPETELKNLQRPGFEANYEDPIASLSPREREIFQLLADGFQNTVIAKKLFISPRTVETHRARVVRKLGLTSNGDLIRFAIKHGLSSL